jgi:hypothetical protein
LFQPLGLLHSQFVCNRHLSKSVAATASDGQVPVSQRGDEGAYLPPCRCSESLA